MILVIQGNKVYPAAALRFIAGRVEPKGNNVWFVSALRGTEAGTATIDVPVTRYKTMTRHRTRTREFTRDQQRTRLRWTSRWTTRSRVIARWRRVYFTVSGPPVIHRKLCTADLRTHEYSYDQKRYRLKGVTCTNLFTNWKSSWRTVWRAGVRTRTNWDVTRENCSIWRERSITVWHSVTPSAPECAWGITDSFDGENGEIINGNWAQFSVPPYVRYSGGTAEVKALSSGSFYTNCMNANNLCTDDHDVQAPVYTNYQYSYCKFPVRANAPVDWGSLTCYLGGFSLGGGGSFCEKVLDGQYFLLSSGGGGGGWGGSAVLRTTVIGNQIQTYTNDVPGASAVDNDITSGKYCGFMPWLLNAATNDYIYLEWFIATAED